MKSTKPLGYATGMSLLALLLAACSRSDNSGFPTGKFVSTDNQNNGYGFKKEG